MTGRNRIPLADMVFSVVFKTYSTVSGRRFMSDLTEARIKGFISQNPHFNSLFNYLEMYEMYPLLRWLITESAKPLKTIDFDFAVDSSGFAKGTTVKWLTAKFNNPKLIDKKDWLKCHLICGVKTNIVASVEITDANGADINQFEPLVAAAAAKEFQISQVSAGKAYLSVRSLGLDVHPDSVTYTEDRVPLPITHAEIRELPLPEDIRNAERFATSLLERHKIAPPPDEQ